LKKYFFLTFLKSIHKFQKIILFVFLKKKMTEVVKVEPKKRVQKTSKFFTPKSIRFGSFVELANALDRKLYTIKIEPPKVGENFESKYINYSILIYKTPSEEEKNVKVQAQYLNLVLIDEFEKKGRFTVNNDNSPPRLNISFFVPETIEEADADLLEEINAFYDVSRHIQGALSRYKPSRYLNAEFHAVDNFNSILTGFAPYGVNAEEDLESFLEEDGSFIFGLRLSVKLASGKAGSKQPVDVVYLQSSFNKNKFKPVDPEDVQFQNRTRKSKRSLESDGSDVDVKQTKVEVEVK
jgi:hypothetical protein